MSELWHDLRSDKVGGSEAAAIFDESPYITLYKLWHMKRGNITPDNLDNVERIQGGKFLEVGIIAWANEKFQFDFYQPQVYVEHATVKGMACTPDAYSCNNSRLMAQVKNVDKWEFREEKGWQSEGDTITAAPLHIMLQVQHEMECADRDESILIVCVGGNRLLQMRCERDREIGSILRSKVAEFWSMPEPEPNFEKDGKEIRFIKSKLKYEDCLDYSSDRELYTILNKSVSLKVKIGRLQDQLDVIDNEIIAAYEGKNIKCKNVFVHYKPRKDGVSFRITMEENTLNK